MQDKESIQETWDKKRIIIGAISLILLGAALFVTKKIFLDKFKDFASNKGSSVSSKVEGVSTKRVEDSDLSKNIDKNLPLSIPKKIDLQIKLDEIKGQVNNLNVTDVASSSPQIQKIINDFQNLQKLPENQVKEACYNICKGI